jgi:hypothetical protein
VCFLNTVRNQWPKSIQKFLGGDYKIQVVQGKKPIDPDADIYIFGSSKHQDFPVKIFAI